LAKKQSPLPKFESKEIRIRLERGRNNEFDIKSTETTVISNKRSRSRPKKLKRAASGVETKTPKLPRVALLARKKNEPDKKDEADPRKRAVAPKLPKKRKN